MSVKAYRATIWVSPLFLVAFQMAMVGAESASIHEFDWLIIDNAAQILID